jgi:pimeloyl-ACP methyl ester carboxylesterase
MHHGGVLECLVAHDWGGAVAWNLANQQPGLLKRLAIINSPHPGAFLRELQHNAAQQAASQYMHFLCSPDAEALLAENDFRACSLFSTPRTARARMVDRGRARPIPRPVAAGLTGACNYYRASPLRPPREGDRAARPGPCPHRC